jgi:hypothetical protein
MRKGNRPSVKEIKMKYLISASMLFILGVSQAYAQNCGGGIPVYFDGGYAGCVANASDVLGPPAQGTPVQLETLDDSDPSYPVYVISDEDTCSSSEGTRQSNAITALANSGLTVHVFSFITVNIADGIDVWTRTGGPPPNTWEFQYSTCDL